MHTRLFRAGAAAVAFVAAGCVEPLPVTSPTDRVAPPAMQLAAAAATLKSEGRYLVVFHQGRAVPAAVTTALRAEGRVEGLHEDLGFAVVSGLSPEGAARISRLAGVGAVEPDIEYQLESVGDAESIESLDPTIESATAPQTASQYARQWNMRAIKADAAWAGGFRGSSNVSVAILDTGIDYLWPDLVGRVDLSRSISLRPVDDSLVTAWFGTTRHPVSDLAAHGTLVSSIVASNSGFFAGVTTQTTLFGVKVCNIFGSCSTAAILNGIVHAVDNGADVINMSLGGGFTKSANPGFVSVINNVFNYANRRGTLIVVSAGNDAADIDHNGNVYATYCNATHVICVSATGPTTAPTAAGPFTNPDAVAPYTNFGRSAISVAAPGGGATTANAFVTGPCSSTLLVWHQPPPETPGGPLPPRVIDGPGCPRNVGLFLLRGAGTSFSAPHVAGVAANIIAATGRSNPSQIRVIIQQSSDDLGQTGTDPFYGKGRLNAGRAVGVLP